ncbi:MAG: hypothetical protein IKV66_11630 [Clostridia bacterium]|nr:hypothetical protein [Clostridia bacterium]
MAFCQWFGANNFWLRGAAVTNATNFGNVNNNGNANNNGNNATNSNGVCPRFS